METYVRTQNASSPVAEFRRFSGGALVWQSKSIARLPSRYYRPRVSVRLTILGSGSSGNCAYLETDQTRLLIDAGLSGRQIRQRLASIGRTPELLHGILITHEHGDHVQGLTTLCAK